MVWTMLSNVNIYVYVWFGRRDANLNELILVRIFYAKPDHFLYRQYIAKNWFELLSKCILIAYVCVSFYLFSLSKYEHRNPKYHKMKSSCLRMKLVIAGVSMRILQKKTSNNTTTMNDNKRAELTSQKA